MSRTDRIDSFGMIGDMRTGALIGANGSLAWLCMPHFDSAASFASILGTADNGVWDLRPEDERARSIRRYDDATLVLETTYASESGTAKVIDFMALDSATPAVIRMIEGVEGSMPFVSRIAPRMHDGAVPPLTELRGDAWIAIVAPDGLCVHSSVPLAAREHDAFARFSIRAGERATFSLQWFSAFGEPPAALDVVHEYDTTRAFWKAWSAQFDYRGEHCDVVLRSAITLKALSSREHGSFVAALTMAIPEKLGGELNWDYRYAWLRDCSFAVESLVRVGFVDEAKAWRTWFSRTYAGCAEHLEIVYALDGSRVPGETDLGWLRGFADSRPVLSGNGARLQFQLGVYGHVLTSFSRAQRAGVDFDDTDWSLVRSLLVFLEANWKRPDSGIWEQRGGLRQFVDSKVMVWVALDRALAMAQYGDLPLDVARWNNLRAEVRDEIERAGFDPARNTFTQSYGSRELDASDLLMIVLGFLQPDDPRTIGTVEAIEKELHDDGYVYRYSATDETGARKEGAFAICGFWLVQAYVAIGRRSDAIALFEKLLSSASELGLFSEEYSVPHRVAIGNFPQAFSHAGLIEAACKLYGPVASGEAP